MGKVLGIDQGISSVGWGIIDTETNDIIDAGVRLFDEADKSNNEKRRNFRSNRRLIRRRKNRREDLKKLLIKYDLYADYDETLNPYQCRLKGLKEELTKEEFNCAIFNISKHRGSSLEVIDEEKSNEETGTKTSLANNDLLLKNNRFVCEIQIERLNKEGKIRGINNNFRTSDYEKELEEIFKNQNISREIQKEICECIVRRRNFSEGPGSFKSQTPYGQIYDENGNVIQNMIQKMAGHCSIYQEELRAPKYAPSAEFFNLLNDLNNLRVDDEPIDIEIKQELINDAFEKGGLTPKQIANKLNVDISDILGFRIDKNDKQLLTELKGYKILKKLFEENNYRESFNTFKNIENLEVLDSIVGILTDTKIIEERERKLSAINSIKDNFVLIKELTNINRFKEYHSLSLKAIRELNKEMFNSQYNQMQILHLSKKYEFAKKKNQKGKKKIELNDEAILSPVALRSYRQAIKVINQARKVYGEFESIVIETTRDRNSQEEKNRIKETQKFFENRNKFCEEIMKNYPNIQLNAKLREKIILYQEQQAKTAYTQQPINLDILINDPTAYEVDHIIPISISLDDSINNKALVTRNENQEKTNYSSPIMAFDKGKFSEGDKESFVLFIKSLKLSNKKYLNYMYPKDINKYENMKDFINRNLVDTSYANRLLLNTLQDYFKDNDINTTIHTVKGIATNRFRKLLKLEKDRDKDYSHHAIDALIVASIKKMNIYSKVLKDFVINEKSIVFNRNSGEIIEKIEDYDLNKEDIAFLKKIEKKQNQIIKYSWAKETKPNRSISDQTIYSTRHYEDGDYFTAKIKDLYAEKIGVQYSPIADDIINGKAKEKYLIYRNDPMSASKLDEVVNFYYQQYKNDSSKIERNKKGEINFKFNPFYELVKDHPESRITKYSKKGKGPVIQSLRYKESKANSYIDISKNYNVSDKKVVLRQLSPYRTDFFLDEGKYKIVTIRYSDIRFNISSNNYEIDKDWYNEQKIAAKISKNAEYKFSMHHNELIKINDGKLEDKVYRYRATKGTGNVVEIKSIDKYDDKRLTPTIGASVKAISKFSCDALGNLYEVKQEKLKLSFK